MKATCLVCTLKRSPEESNSEAMAQVVLDALRKERVETDVIRLADHQIDFGVVSEAVTDGDEWPGIRDRVLASDPRDGDSDVARPAVERLEGRARADGRLPVGDERGRQDAHRLQPRGRRRRGRQRRRCSPRHRGVAHTEERDWSITTAKACASNLLAMARALESSPITPPPEG
jgi:IS5 family transposase